jgi:DNA polymerase-1
LTADGRRAWQRFTETHAEERNAENFPPHLIGPWSKLRGYAARLALIVHFLRWACGETQGEDVDGESMTRAALLVDYFKAHARKVYAVMDADPRLALARRLLRHVGEQRLAQFTRREAYRAMRGPCKAVDGIDPILAVLETHGYIRPVQSPAPTGRPGRKPSLTYEIHPSTLGQNGHIGQNAAQRRPATRKPADSVHYVHSVQGYEEANGALRDEEGPGEAPYDARKDEVQPVSSDGAVVDEVGELDPVEVSLPMPYRPDDASTWGGRLVRDPAELASVAQAIDESVRVAVDVETTGLDPQTDRVRLLTLATDRGVWLVDCLALDPSRLWDVLAERPLLFHNALFDLQFLRRLGFEPGAVADTFLLSRLLHGCRRARRFHSLAECAARELGRRIDKAEQKSDWSGALAAGQLVYASLDAAVLLPLYEALDTKVREAGLAQAAEIEKRCLPAVVWLSASGIGFDADGWHQLANDAAVRTESLARELDAAAPDRPGHLTREGAFDWNSPQQVKEAFALLGHALDSTDDDALAGVAHPLAGLLRDYRSAGKLVSTYGVSWYGDALHDGRVYAGWQQIGADSGRIACSKPNLQNLPRDSRYRRCFLAPAGRVLVRADYSQIELRIAAKVSGDKAMLDAYRADQDLHTLTCQRVLGSSEVTKEQRQLAKAINFGLLYGMGVKGFRAYALAQYGLRLSEADATRYREAFFAAYPGLRHWHRSIGTAPIDTRTLAGRLRKDVGRFTEKLNTPVQGTGADGLKLALANLWERRAECPGALPVLAVHDEIVVECDAGKAEAVGAWVARAMKDAMAPLIAPVPVEVEVKFGRTWAGD